MNDFDDLVRRSLATAGMGPDEEGTARRKARFKASIAELETDPRAQARIDGIAAAVGIVNPADSAPPGIPENMRPHDRPGRLNPASHVIRSWKRLCRLLRRAPGQRKAATRLGDYLAWLGGGDPAMLAQLPEERSRFVQMAGVLFTTSGIAAISMMFALHDAVNTSSLAAVVLSLLWGAVIFNIDRLLVLSMGRTRNRWRMIWMTLPRLALAAVLALVISTPLVLRTFASDINTELVTLHQQEASQQALEARSSPQGQQAARVQEQINTAQAVLDGHLTNTITSPQLQSAQARVNTLQAQAQHAYQAEITARKTWQCQVYGQTCDGVSAKPGYGAIAQADYQQYQQAVAAYNSLQSQLATAQIALSKAQGELTQTQSTRLAQQQAEARASLPRLQAELQVLENQIQKATTAASAASNADTGILAQLQALSEASAKSPSLEAARLTVLILFLLIEVLPVTVKFLLNLGPPTAYETAVQLQAEQVTRLTEMRHAERLRIEEMRFQARIDAEKETLRREGDAGRKANEDITSRGYIQASVDPAATPTKQPGQHKQPLNGENCTVILTDVVAFGAHTRTDRDRLTIREALFRMMETAMQGIPDVRSEDRGDGVLMVIPPAVSTARVMDRLLHVLPGELDRHNSSQREPARIQLRLAVNVGPVVSNAMGVSGEAIIVAARLLEAPDFKEALARSKDILGIIASPFIYEAIIQRSLDPSYAASYSPVPIQVKESRTTGWMKLFTLPQVQGSDVMSRPSLGQGHQPQSN